MPALAAWEEVFLFDWRTGVVLSTTGGTAHSGTPASTLTTQDNNGLTNYLTGTTVFPIFRTTTTTPTAAHGGNGILAGAIAATASNVFGVPVTNRPVFNSGQEVRQFNKAIGTPVPTGGVGYNFGRGTLNPSTSYEFDADYRTLVPFLWSFFQKGAVQTAAGTSAADYLYSFICPTDASPEMFAQLAMHRTADPTKSYLISDAVATSMRLSAAENDPLKASFDFMGRMLDYSFDTTATALGYNGTSYAGVKFPEKNPFYWQNSRVYLGNQAADDISVTSYLVTAAQSFDLSVSASVKPLRYNNKFPIGYLYTGFNISGSLAIPWSAATVGSTYLQSRLQRNDDPNETLVAPIPINITWVGNADGDFDTHYAGASVSTADMASVLSFGDDDTTFTNDEGDMSISVSGVPSSVVDQGDDEVIINLSLIGADTRISNAISFNACKIQIYEETAVYAIP